MSTILQKASKLFFSSFAETALLSGTSDIIVVHWRTGELKSTPFLACFGSNLSSTLNPHVNIYINGSLISALSSEFSVDKYGYLQPKHPSMSVLRSLQLSPGRNIIQFQLCDKSKHNISQKLKIQAEIYQYEESEKLVISDMDGTVTKSDVCGLYSNYRQINYLHDGYHQLIENAYRNGYKIVWLTMRSLPLYNFSKQYLRQESQMHGPLLTEPQELLPALKKQIMHKTSNIKANMLLTLRNLFPSHANPFMGGLGNRQNDAIAYRAAGIEMQNIYIIDTQSNVHHLGDGSRPVSYGIMSERVQSYFPRRKSKMIRRASEQQREEKTSQLQKLREELAELGETIKSKIMDEFDDLTH